MIVAVQLFRKSIIWQIAVFVHIHLHLVPSGHCFEFTAKVFPILRESCMPCHNSYDKKGGLYFDNYRGISELISNPSLVIRKKPENSRLMRLISGEDPKETMPPKGRRLNSDEIKAISSWIHAGGSVPENYNYDYEIQHWAFQEINYDDPDHHRKSIDYFIEKSLAKKGLDLSPPADKTTLHRRLHQVVIGMPPGKMEIKSHLDNTSNENWETLVDKTLNSFGYGENIASHWLDLVRFGETDGFETNRERPNAWHYRDWVINAFNKDMPYDQFVRNQLAGDSLGDPVGTSFLVAGPIDIVKGQDPLLGLVQRQNELDDFANTTSTTFIGLTLGCARCHDHKFDPISQEDYYAMQAIFQGVKHGNRDIYSGQFDTNKLRRLENSRSENFKKLKKITKNYFLPAINGVKNIESFEPIKADYVRFEISETKGSSEPCLDEIEVYSGKENVALSSLGVKASSSGDFQHPLHRLPHINDGFHGNSKSWIAHKASNVWVQLTFPKPTMISKIIWSRDRTGKFSDRLPEKYKIIVGLKDKNASIIASHKRRGYLNDNQPLPEITEILEPLNASEGVVLKKLYSEINSIDRELESFPKKVPVYAGQFTSPGETRLLYRGEPNKPRGIVKPGVIKSLGAIGIDGNSSDKERRLELADWITDNSNPLTARVMVNRIWQFHFGRGLVSTPNDFGRNGTPPSHPELLDWLACEFIKKDWSIKHIHKIILQSKTWQQSSKPRKDGMNQDAQGQFYWRFTPRRIRAEVLRDSILKISSSLNTKRGGPGFSAFEVELENVRHYHPRKNYGPNEWRRMVYMTRVRQEKDSVFGIFDCPDGSQSVAIRPRSTTPLQALNLFNSEFVIEQANIYSNNLKNRYKNNVKNQIEGAFWDMFSRAPSLEEIELSMDLVKKAGLQSLARALFNSNEFTFIY